MACQNCGRVHNGPFCPECNHGLEDVLREFTKYLCEHGYCDDDVWCENDAVADFMNEHTNG